MGQLKLTICHLYPKLLNIYGDRGNIICLTKRCQWRKIKVEIKQISVNDNLKAKTCDLFFGGGGQDKQQLIVSQDLQKKGSILREEAERGVPMLTICGTYQLFGYYFKTQNNKKIPGIGIFNTYTIASNKRKIGNIVVKITNSRLSTINHSLVGFENHSGNTFIDSPSTSFSRGSLRKQPRRLLNLGTSGKENNVITLPLGKAIKGFGNNGQDKTAGAIYKNAIGTYLHGPILPKNPNLADWLIKKSLEVKYKKKFNLQPLDDDLEWQAHQSASKRH